MPLNSGRPVSGVADISSNLRRHRPMFHVKRRVQTSQAGRRFAPPSVRAMAPRTKKAGVGRWASPFPDTRPAGRPPAEAVPHAWRSGSASRGSDRVEGCGEAPIHPWRRPRRALSEISKRRPAKARRTLCEKTRPASGAARSGASPPAAERSPNAETTAATEIGETSPCRGGREQRPAGRRCACRSTTVGRAFSPTRFVRAFPELQLVEKSAPAARRRRRPVRRSA